MKFLYPSSQILSPLTQKKSPSIPYELFSPQIKFLYTFLRVYHQFVYLESSYLDSFPPKSCHIKFVMRRKCQCRVEKARGASGVKNFSGEKIHYERVIHSCAEKKLDGLTFRTPFNVNKFAIRRQAMIVSWNQNGESFSQDLFQYQPICFTHREPNRQPKKAYWNERF